MCCLETEGFDWPLTRLRAVLAPLSEVFGRNTIYIVSHLLYTVLFVALGRAPNIATVIVIRFLSGAFGSTGSTMVGGSLAGEHASSIPMRTAALMQQAHRHLAVS